MSVCKFVIFWGFKALWGDKRLWRLSCLSLNPSKLPFSQISSYHAVNIFHSLIHFTVGLWSETIDQSCEMSNLLHKANLPNQAQKSRQIQHIEGIKSTQKATSWEQKQNILSYNPGLKTEFHISCSHLPKTILDFAKLCILPDFLPQPSNFFTRIYPPYP